MQLHTGAEHMGNVGNRGILKWLQLLWMLLNVRITSRKCLRTVIHSVQHSSTGLFEQNYCLNGLEIKDDSVWYTRQHLRTNVLKILRETSVFGIK